MAGDGATLATPLPFGPGTFVPEGSVLSAPIITPYGMKHGSHLFEVYPAGANPEPFYTRKPGKYITDQPSDSSPYLTERTGWLTLEFLYWATQGPSAPPLVTTGPAALGPGGAAVVGQPGTQDLLGGGRALNSLRPGFRFEIGGWLDDANKWALSHRFFYLGSMSDNYVGVANGLGVVNVPQATPTPGGLVQSPLYVGFPGLTRGTVTASLQTNLLGGDTNVRRSWRASDAFRIDLLGGYRYLHLGDSLSDSFDVLPANGSLAPRLMGEDSVRTRNDFHGGQVGLGATGRIGRFTVEVQSTVALGVTVGDLDQSRTRAVFGAPVSALGSNATPLVLAAHNQTDYFSVMPEFGVKLGWQPIDHVRLTVGYDVLYWSRVRRAQEQYDQSATLRDTTTDFWAQGLVLGLELRY